MDAAQTTLRRIRNWFVVWFIAEAVVGTAVAASMLDSMGRQPFLRYALGGVGAAGTVVAGVIVSLVLLLLATALLDAMQRLQPWARIAMLVIGWITVASAALSLLMLPASAALLESIVEFAGGNWPALVVISALTELADLAYWGWVVYVLQMNPAVRNAFIHTCRHPAHA